MADQKREFDAKGVDMEALIAEWKDSKNYNDQYTRDFPQLDNLVDAVPIIKDDGAPFVGDTTLAGLVRSIPRGALKQLPVLIAEVNGSSHNYYAILCNYFLKEYAFNEDTFGKGLLSTLQIGTEQALTHGYQPFLVASGLMYNDFGATMRLLYYRDTSPEPGISDSNESGYHFVSAHLTPGRVRKIKREAEANKNTAWNIEALTHVLESTPVPQEKNQYQSDPRKIPGADEEGRTYEFVTRYETGRSGRIITFCAEYPDAPLRILENKSKWGYPRVQYLVIDPAPLTPFGISRVRLASPNQNFMNIYYANVAAMLLLNSAPPLFKKGSFLGPTSLKRNAVWETVDPNAEIALKTLDNGSLSQFVPMAQQLAAQIQNIMGGQSMTVNAGSKGSAFGKTAPGVEAGQAFMGLETNQITKILENFLRQYALVALDTLISEQSGEDDVIVDDETKDMLNTLEEQKYNKEAQKDPMTGLPLEPFVPSIGDDNIVKLVWEDFYKAIKKWSVKVNVSLSPDELKESKRADLQDMLVVLAQNARELGPEAINKVQEITNMLLKDKTPLVEPMSPAAPMQPSVPAMDPMGGQQL